jgi:hypothetical protein
MDKNAGLCPDKPCAFGDGTPMIAVRGTADRHTCGNRAHVRLMKLADIDLAADTPLRLFEQESDDRMTSTESFEAAEAEPVALVLHVDRMNSNPGCQGRETKQGCRAMVRPAAQKPLNFPGRKLAEHLSVCFRKRLSIVRM